MDGNDKYTLNTDEIS